MLTLIHDSDARLQFDPVDTGHESVAFDIEFSWSMPNQNHQISIRECWFLLQSLRDFESQLAELIESDQGVITLNNMDDFPILTIFKDGNAAQIMIAATDTCGMGKLQFTMNTYELDIARLHDRLHKYPKWW